jgi:alpha-galactosidase
MTFKHQFILIFIFFFTRNEILAQQVFQDCKASLKDDTLTIGNSKIERKWLWNNGDIIPFSVKNISSGKSLFFEGNLPSFNMSGRKFIKNESINIAPIGKNFYGSAHLSVTVSSIYDELDVKRVFKIYPSVATITMDIFLKYKRLNISEKASTQIIDGIEKGKEKQPEVSSYLDQYPLNTKHWLLKIVEFRDITDDRNNLVFEKQIIPYRANEEYRGNLLLANDLASNFQFFILKESPNSSSQVNYPQYDFTASNKLLKIGISGFEEKNNGEDWIKGYSTAFGVPDENGDNLLSLRNYLKKSISYNVSKHEMIMMNTWGDRSKDGKISEKFVLKELESAKKLGITHFQIDDGWQEGLSSNSIDKSGNLWDAWTAKDWEPNKVRFPNGLTEIVKSAKEKNIQLGLWFHPTNNASYALWKSDADILIGIYKKYGISYFKIDGVKISTKEAEINFTKFLEAVKSGTNDTAFFNMDLTANIRGGYFMFRNTGNLFLENRYTDFGNYYPFHTLRNLWMLSQYFPPELLQIEFLNKWRNQDKYIANDPFAPSNYSFDYIFAVSTMAQPLAWLEANNLPEEAYNIAPFIKKYASIMADIHKGSIMPIGDMPTGNSWTGFQSVKEDSGYFLIFRERNEINKKEITPIRLMNKKISIEKIYSNNPNSSIIQKKNGNVEITLSEQNSFVLAKYQIIK